MKKIIRFLVKILRAIKRRYSKFVVKNQLKEVGDNFICDEDVTIYGGENISIGNNVTINKGVILQSCDGAKITIDNEVVISFGTKIITGNLLFSSTGIDDRKHANDSIKVGKSVWLGTNVIILPGVSISDNIIVAAGSVVSKSLLDENYIFAGVPAKKIKKLCD